MISTTNQITKSPIRPSLVLERESLHALTSSVTLTKYLSGFSSCGQYNGFTKDGDYNRQIPEQCQNPDEEPGSEPVHFAVRDAVSRSASPSSNTGDGHDANGLCTTCNLNQVKTSILV